LADSASYLSAAGALHMTTFFHSFIGFSLFFPLLPLIFIVLPEMQWTKFGRTLFVFTTPGLKKKEVLYLVEYFVKPNKMKESYQHREKSNLLNRWSVGWDFSLYLSCTVKIFWILLHYTNI